MKSFKWLFLLLLICSFCAAVMAACDDDDDDNDAANGGTDDDNADDDVLGNPNYMSECIAMQQECWDLDAATAEELCQDYLDLEQACSAGAAERFIDCLDGNCDNWDDCAATWEDEINC
ncbi:MAG: hypothetical protein ACTSXZ_09395 [Alphaproteobacteria bacterium]